MVEYDGQAYEVHRSHWGGEVYAYLVDGKFTLLQPCSKVYVGYIKTQLGVLEVWRSRVPVRAIVAVVAIIVACILLNNTRPVTEYYRVSFAESPIYRDGILYCNVVNVSDREVTVQFLDGAHSSVLVLLRPGETIPTVELDFVPSVIQYDQQHTFELEVQYDGF